MENYSLSYESSFDLCDYMYARDAFNKWQIEQNCDIDEYIIRKRKAELERLVRKVIKNELDERDILIVNLHWYKGYSQKQIAGMLGVEQSTICRRLDKINETIYEKLKYAIEYRYGFTPSPSVDFLSIAAIPDTAEGSGADFSRRLSRLRHKHYLSLKDVSKATGISTDRLEKLEKGRCNLKVRELLLLSQLFSVSTDYILKGKNSSDSPEKKSEGKAV